MGDEDASSFEIANMPIVDYMDSEEIKRRLEIEIQDYAKRGLECSMWGRATKDMDREELLAFIGFLDEFISRVKDVVM